MQKIISQKMNTMNSSPEPISMEKICITCTKQTFCVLVVFFSVCFAYPTYWDPENLVSPSLIFEMFFSRNVMLLSGASHSQPHQQNTLHQKTTREGGAKTIVHLQFLPTPPPPPPSFALGHLVRPPPAPNQHPSSTTSDNLHCRAV